MKNFIDLYKLVKIIQIDDKHNKFIDQFINIISVVKEIEDLMSKPKFTKSSLFKILEGIEYIKGIYDEISDEPNIEVFDDEFDVKFQKNSSQIDFREKLNEFNNLLMDDSDLNGFFIDVVFSEIYDDFYGILYTPLDENSQKIINNFVYDTYLILQQNSWDTRIGHILEFFNEDRRNKYLL
jgi:hypothetical protein